MFNWVTPEICIRLHQFLSETFLFRCWEYLSYLMGFIRLLFIFVSFISSFFFLRKLNTILWLYLLFQKFHIHINLSRLNDLRLNLSYNQTAVTIVTMFADQLFHFLKMIEQSFDKEYLYIIKLSMLFFLIF